MEDSDDITKGPREDGGLNLSYSNWCMMPEELFIKYKRSLMYLNLSHNHIDEVPCEVADLTLLKEINLAHNCLQKIDRGMSKCIRLRKVDLSHNQLVNIPDEVISECKFLVSH